MLTFLVFILLSWFNFPVFPDSLIENMCLFFPHYHFLCLLGLWGDKTAQKEEQLERTIHILFEWKAGQWFCIVLLCFPIAFKKISVFPVSPFLGLSRPSRALARDNPKTGKTYKKTQNLCLSSQLTKSMCPAVHYIKSFGRKSPPLNQIELN